MGRGGEATALMDNSHAISETYGGTSTQEDSLSKQQPQQLVDTLNDDTYSSRQEPPSLYSTRNLYQFLDAWIILGVAFLVGLVAGSLYGFGRYAKDLRELLEVSQMTVQRFGILLDTGNYIGHPLTGWIYDNFGAKKSCLTAAFIVFCSYASIHLGLSSAPIWTMDIGFFGVGFGSGLAYIAGLGSATSFFAGTPHLGRAVGIVAAGYGFSSTLVGVVYHRTGLAYFFLLWASLAAVMNVTGAFVFSRQKYMLASEGDASSVNDSLERDMEEELLPIDNSSETATQPEDVSNIKWSSWKRMDFWLLFGSFSSITGCGLMIINNISTMVQSIGGTDSLTGYLVVGLSISNVTGRILMGALADHPKLHKLDLYRYASLVMAIALAISAIGGNSVICLAATVSLAAISYGGSWVLIIGILADFYGKDNFGKDYGLIAMGPALSGMIYNVMSARLYESHADQNSGICMGVECYHDAFWMTGASATFGYFILLWFLPRRPRSEEEENSIRYIEAIETVAENEML